MSLVFEIAVRNDYPPTRMWQWRRNQGVRPQSSRCNVTPTFSVTRSNNEARISLDLSAKITAVVIYLKQERVVKVTTQASTPLSRVYRRWYRDRTAVTLGAIIRTATTLFRPSRQLDPISPIIPAPISSTLCSTLVTTQLSVFQKYERNARGKKSNVPLGGEKKFERNYRTVLCVPFYAAKMEHSEEKKKIEGNYRIEIWTKNRSAFHSREEKSWYHARATFLLKRRGSCFTRE